MENINTQTKYNTLNSYKTYFTMFIFMMIFSLLYNIILGIIFPYTGLTAEQFNNNNIVTYIGCTVSPIMFFCLFLWQNRRQKFVFIKENLGFNKKIKCKHVVLSVVTAFICLYLFSGIANLFDYSLEFIGFNPSDSLNLPKSNIGYLFLNILVLAIMPAIFEELIFRGIIFKGLINEHKPVVAIVLTTFMFAFMHGTLQQTFYQIILGLIITIVMYVTDNIIYPIIVHFVNNAIIVVLDFFTTNSSTVTFDLMGIIDVIILAFIGVIFFYLLFEKLIKNKKTSTDVLEFKTFKSYSLDEKKYALLSLILAGLIWLVGTFSVIFMG